LNAHSKEITLTISRNGKEIFSHSWDSLEEFQRESLPRVFGRHLAKTLIRECPGLACNLEKIQEALKEEET